MSSVQRFETARREYKVKTWKRVLYLLLATLFGSLSVVLMAIPGGSEPLVRWVAGPVFLAICVYVVCYAFRSRLVIDGSRIEVRTAFGEKTADLEEVEGFRTITTRNGSYRELVLKNSAAIALSQSLSFDDDFQAWLQQIPDLDERDRDELIKEISANAELGGTPEERLGALKKAKATSVGLLIVAVAAGVGLNLGPESIRKLCAVLLALVPVTAYILIRRSPLLYVALKRKRDPRAELSYLPMLAGFGLFLSSRNVHLVTVQPLLLISALILVACVLAFYGISKSSSVRGAVVIMVSFCGFYAWGLAEVADTLFDRSTPSSFTVTVVGGHVSHGKSTNYYLRLAPWGPVTEEKDVSVSADLYRGMSIGDVVCTSMHHGAIGVAWFTVAACPDQTGAPAAP